MELAGKEGEVDLTLSSRWWSELEEQKFLEKMNLIMLGAMLEYDHLEKLDIVCVHNFRQPGVLVEEAIAHL